MFIFFNDIVGVSSSPKARFELGDIVIGWFRWGVHRDSTKKEKESLFCRLNGSRLYNKTINSTFRHNLPPEQMTFNSKPTIASRNIQSSYSYLIQTRKSLINRDSRESKTVKR